MGEYKEVDFHKYCSSCKHSSKKESDEPCDECLADSSNMYSHKPIRWEEKE